MSSQSPEDIAAEIYNSFINGKNARLELWGIGMNPHFCLPEMKDLWLAWRAGWETIDCQIRDKVSKLLNFKPKHFNN